jgi:hypothetical protein
MTDTRQTPDLAPVADLRAAPPAPNGAATDDCYVSLRDLASAQRDLAYAELDNPDRESLKATRDAARAGWIREHARINEDYFGNEPLTGAVLTFEGVLYLSYTAGEIAVADIRLAEILTNVERLETLASVLLPIDTQIDEHERFRDRSRRLRDGRRRSLVGAQLYSIARYVLALVDYAYWLESRITELRANDGVGSVQQELPLDTSENPMATAAHTVERDHAEADALESRKEGITASALEVARKGLRAAEEALWHEARTLAAARYVVGMLVGLIPIIGLAILGGRLIRSSQVNAVFLAFAVAAGAVGAGISVLTRLVSGSLRVDPAATPNALRISGASRVVVGAIFGAVLFVFGASGLVSLPQGSASPPTAYLWISLGFLAGFSERWVQDLLGSVETTSRTVTNQGAPGSESPGP